MKQFTLTPAAGKRLIGKGMAGHPAVASALESSTIVIIAGTTNAYVAEEILDKIGQREGFDRRRFYRGITLPPGYKMPEAAPSAGESGFIGDVVIEKGVWQKGKTIFDVADSLKEGDLVLKGANALDLEKKRAAILIGHPKAGTIGAAMLPVFGRRVQLILPVGLEKRVAEDLDVLAEKLNAPGVEGPRFLPAPGQAFTEIDAIETLTGAHAELVASGGVCGAEGSIWLAVDGSLEQMQAAESLLKGIMAEPAFTL